ncbi:MAG: tetratricopeptide repeat protein [Myxococcota bacterium]
MRHIVVPTLFAALAACGGAPSAPTKAESTPAPAAQASAAAAASASTASPAAKAAAAKAHPVTFEAQLALLDAEIAARKKVAQQNGRSGLAFGNVASLYMTRARLSGDWGDYAAAEENVDQAFAVSKTGKTGPFIVRARLNYTLHRLDRVDEDFATAAKLPTNSGDAKRSHELFAANLAFQRGQYDDAKKALDEHAKGPATLPGRASLALYHWKSGNFEDAERLYTEAMEAHDGKATEPVAWVHLQLGLMDLDRGRWDEALAHYRAGASLIRGYWLIDEHMAEILTLQGKTDEAKALYQSIIERTGNPEFMDAMAEIHAAAGEDGEAEAWAAKARAAFEDQLRQFPEAAYGHALGHFLAHGTDPERTVQMAERNHALRPNADAKAMLAEAYLAAGRLPDADRLIDEALATPMRSASLHATAAQIKDAVGNKGAAKAQRKAARAINPKIELD